MSSKQKQAEVFIKASKSLEKHLNEKFNHNKADDIHKLRIEIKKIDAILFLYKKCYPKKKIPLHLDPLRKLFKHLGLIRTAYLNLKLARQHHIVNEQFIEAQKHTIASQTEKLKSQHIRYSFSITNASLKLAEQLPKLNSQNIDEAYLRQFKRTIKYFRKKNYDTQLHRNRKRIKFLLYNQRFLSPGIVQKVKPEIKRLESIQNVIGQRNDYLTVIELLRTVGENNEGIMNQFESEANEMLLKVYSIAEELGSANNI